MNSNDLNQKQSPAIDSMHYIITNPSFDKFPTNKRYVRLAVLASGVGSNFDAIINSINKKDIKGEVVILISNIKNSGAVSKAIKNNIKYKIVDHKMFRDRNEHEMEIIKILDNLQIDIVIMAGWMRIATPLLINAYKNRILNIHPSLLPSFKGINAVEQALEYGVMITGCSVHIVEENVDSGRIIIQAMVPILKNDTKKSLKNRIQNSEHKILPLAVALLASNL